MKNVFFAYSLIIPLTLFLLQPWQVDAAYRDTNDFCKGAPCHTGTTGMPEGVPLSESDDKVHDLCSDCHDPNSGQLIGSAAGREGNATNKCIDCHGGPTRFLAHLHHKSFNKVSYDNGLNDTSQSGQQGCQDCHGSVAPRAAHIRWLPGLIFFLNTIIPAIRVMIMPMNRMWGMIPLC